MGSMQQGDVTFEVEEVLRESDSGLAFLVQVTGGGSHWIPKSQIRDPEEVDLNQTFFDMTIPGWLAQKNQII